MIQLNSGNATKLLMLLMLAASVCLWSTAAASGPGQSGDKWRQQVTESQRRQQQQQQQQQQQREAAMRVGRREPLRGPEPAWMHEDVDDEPAQLNIEYGRQPRGAPSRQPPATINVAPSGFALSDDSRTHDRGTAEEEERMRVGGDSTSEHAALRRTRSYYNLPGFEHEPAMASEIEEEEQQERPSGFVESDYLVHQRQQQQAAEEAKRSGGSSSQIDIGRETTRPKKEAAAGGHGAQKEGGGLLRKLFGNCFGSGCDSSRRRQ